MTDIQIDENMMRCIISNRHYNAGERLETIDYPGLSKKLIPVGQKCTVINCGCETISNGDFISVEWDNWTELEQIRMLRNAWHKERFKRI